MDISYFVTSSHEALAVEKGASQRHRIVPGHGVKPASLVFFFITCRINDALQIED